MPNDFDDAARDLMQMDRAIQNALPIAAEQGSLPVKREAIARAPRGATRKLVRSIDDKEVESDRNHAVHAVVVGAYYGFFHEYGTSKMPAHPFVRPAADTKKPEVLAAMQRVIKAAATRALA